ncbi:hypothetical protein [Rhodococcus sp. PD04]|uniref:hypothetical protein n=1 Tax=Rhodococcus sp. PD04 TaxID=3109594 RepID=UPI002DDC3756|nr:hypothetical protein [Rhodococcus sp. PD04]WSE22333.1 hypothetical protein U9J23_22205 [Rhodococcus sp. PD04]
MMDTDSYKHAYQSGVAASKIIGAPNPYVPFEPGSRRERLAQLWVRGRLHDMPKTFFDE